MLPPHNLVKSKTVLVVYLDDLVGAYGLNSDESKDNGKMMGEMAFEDCCVIMYKKGISYTSMLVVYSDGTSYPTMREEEHGGEKHDRCFRLRNIPKRKM